MINLSQAVFIGKGKNKQCYVHPEDPSLCIKVSNEGANPKELKKELREFIRLRKKAPHRHSELTIPKYHGSLETSLGTGYVFDRIVKADGSYYPTLKQHLQEKSPNRKVVTEIIQKLYNDIYQSAAIISELNADNVLVLSANPYQFSLVDGFGEGASLKISEWHPHFARRKFTRKFPFLKAEIERIANTIL